MLINTIWTTHDNEQYTTLFSIMYNQIKKRGQSSIAIRPCWRVFFYEKERKNGQNWSMTKLQCTKMGLVSFTACLVVPSIPSMYACTCTKMLASVKRTTLGMSWIGIVELNFWLDRVMSSPFLPNIFQYSVC